jgi:hypothetical protein
VMRDEGCLLYRCGENQFDTRKHEGKVVVKGGDVRWSSDGGELRENIEMGLRQTG